MIRRHEGDRFYLIAQNDHAQLSGQLASHFGNGRFERPEPWAETVAAAGLHDGGWPLHDDRPTLNKAGLPLDVFETPLELALRVWRESADRAGEKSDYAQLLVSLHVLGLSAYAASRPHTPREVFELNKFQQYEIERQEVLRRRLGLRVDVPLRMGLAEGKVDAGEEQLKRNHYVIQMADRISLGLCCTEVVAPRIENMIPRLGERAVTLELARKTKWCMVVEPWPFDEPVLRFVVPYRSVPARAYRSEEDLAGVWGRSRVEQAEFTLQLSM
jgi:hypothetical protein